MKKRIVTILIFTLSGITLTGCKNKDSSAATESQVQKNSPVFQEVDYSELFQGIDGCAVFYESDSDKFRLYNEQAGQEQISPCSTFKIISTLIGLEKGIIDSENSTMGYDYTNYPVETWNSDLTLKEAFESSCIWYFKKIIDQAGQYVVQETLTEIGYGNCDVSEWDGRDVNPLPDLNGFWLESSLKISPQEQVEVLRRIFDGQTNFSAKNIDILKRVMFVDTYGNVSVYGKTGTGMGNGWFAGIAENGNNQYYFAVHLEDENNRVSGNQAKEIALNIIAKYYSE